MHEPPVTAKFLFFVDNAMKMLKPQMTSCQMGRVGYNDLHEDLEWTSKGDYSADRIMLNSAPLDQAEEAHQPGYQSHLDEAGQQS